MVTVTAYRIILRETPFESSAVYRMDPWSLGRHRVRTERVTLGLREGASVALDSSGEILIRPAETEPPRPLRDSLTAGWCWLQETVEAPHEPVTRGASSRYHPSV